MFDGTDACVAPVLSLTEAPHHPHLAGAWDVRRRAVGAPGPAHRPEALGHPAPGTPEPSRVPGADTTAYLVAHGFSAEEVEALRGLGRVVQA